MSRSPYLIVSRWLIATAFAIGLAVCLPFIGHVDLMYALQQGVFFAVLITAPAFLYAAGRPQTLPIGHVLITFALAMASLVWLILWCAWEVWGPDILSQPHMRLGPSQFSMPAVAYAVAVVTWVPTLFAWSVWRWQRQVGASLSIWVRIVFVACAMFTLFGLYVAEYTFEDTVTAPEFTLSAWKQVRIGQTREEVNRLLGTPLSDSAQPRFAGDSDIFWVMNDRAGWFAMVSFSDDRVAKARMWFSD